MLYIIVFAPSPKHLVEEVNLRISEGFIPLGGVTVDINGNYVQAMTRG